MTASPTKKSASPYVLLLLAIIVVTVPIGLIKFTEHYKEASAAGKVHDELMARLRKAGRHSALTSVEGACGDKKSCECLKAQIREALNANFHELSLTLIDSRKCKELFFGMRAEALARAGQFQQATVLAQSVLESDASEPFALYALAHAEHFTGGSPLVLEQIQASIAAQRGAPSYLLEFLHHYNQNAWEPAERAALQILELDPRDPEGLYNLALIHHKRDNYQGAREGYLKLLSVVPEHANARYNLGVLTHSVGALDESRHNLTKLIAIVGADDERAKGLEAIIEGPPPSPANRFVFDRAMNDE